MNKTSGVYLITNIVDNKLYIGESVNVYKRLNMHKNSLRRGDHVNTHLQNAFNLHGEESFEFSLLEEHPPEFTKSFENYWVNMLGTIDCRYGYNMRSTSPYGRSSHTEESRIKISSSGGGGKVYQYNLDGSFVKEFPYVSAAARSCKTSSSHIAECCRNVLERPSAGGYLWSRLKLDKLPAHVRRNVGPKDDEHKAMIKRTHKSLEKKLYKIDPELLVVIDSYLCVRDAAKELGYDPSYLSRSCREGNSCGGFCWSYSPKKKDWKFKKRKRVLILTSVDTGKEFTLNSLSETFVFLGVGKGCEKSVNKAVRNNTVYKNYLIRYR